MSPDVGEPLPSVAEVFDTVRRFHVYDHHGCEWVMSGAYFDDLGRCVISNKYDEDDLTEFSHPGIVAEGADELSLVWEDGPDTDLETGIIDLDAAKAVGSEIADLLTERVDVDPGRVRVVSFEAPNQVSYFTIADGAEVTERGGGDA